MARSAWHALSIDAIAKHFSTDVAHGLSEEEAAKRLAKGANKLPEPKQDSFLKLLLRQVASPIALVLVFATIAALFVGTKADVIVIAAALLVNVALGTFQERRAGNAFASLRRQTETRTSIIRDGTPGEVPASQVVPGDLVLLSAGTAVPADVRLSDVHELAINEAALTGEWAPVAKNTEQAPEDAVLADRDDMAYAGTLVTAGAGQGIVVATGTHTELGSAARELLEVEETESPLVHDMRRAAQYLLVLAVVAIALVFGMSIVHGIALTQAALIAVAVAVASVPEGLPAAVTVALALGMERILKVGGLAKGLLSAETLGATSVILTDKTGTLTEGRMRAARFVTTSGTTSGLTDPEAQKVLRAALLASDGYVEEVDGPPGRDEKLIARGRPIEQAILFAALEAGISESAWRGEHPQLDVLPFDASRRFGGMLVKENSKQVVYLSGAPEVFLPHVRKHADATRFARILKESAHASERVIAVARAPWHADTMPQKHEIEGLLAPATVIGLITFTDPVRKEAPEAVAQMQAAGARVIMATGDNPETAMAVARAVGIAGPHDRPHTGAEFAGMTDSALYQLLMTHPVFARVAPADKLHMVRVLQEHSEIVAMTGDGVNDAPALRAAAIGVAVGSGTDVAKEAADIILLKDSFAVITAAIREGRRLRDNVKKIFTYLVATNFGETFVIVAALALGLPLPILPTQILWANLVTGGPMNIAFAFEPLYPSAMKRKPRSPENAHVLSPNVLKLIAAVGLSTGVLLIGLFLWLVWMGVPEMELRTVMFVALSFDSMFIALSLKSFGTPLTRIPFKSNVFLLLALLGSVIMVGIALFVPLAQYLLQTMPLSARDIGLLLLIGLADLALVEYAKYLFYIRPSARRANARVQV